jgi:hypothetical protein
MCPSAASRWLAYCVAVLAGFEGGEVEGEFRWRDKSTAVGWGACGCFISYFCDGSKTCLLAQMPNNLINSMVIAPSLIPLPQNCAPIR